MERSTYTADELFHFVGRRRPDDDDDNYQVLSKILKARCISFPPDFPTTSRVSYTFNAEKSLITEDLIVPTITCYCDIPLDHLRIHTKKYGRFGLSFGRDHLTRYGARPVMYVPMRSDDWGSINGQTLLRNLGAVYEGFREHVSDPIQGDGYSSYLGERPADAESAIREMESAFAKDFLAFLKPFNSELPDDHPDNYYMEREWRRYGCLNFQPQQVRRVVIARGFIGRLTKDFPEYAEKITTAPE